MLNSLEKINKSPFFQSITIVLVCIALHIIGPVSIFETNDDVFYSLVMSGNLLTSNPDAHIIFINFILSSLFVKLYLMVPNLPWFGIFQVSSLLLAVFFLNYIYATVHNSKYIIRLVLSITCILPFIYYIQFTKTSFVLALTGYFCLYLLNIDKNSSSLQHILLNSLSATFIVLSFLLRKESFFLATILCIVLMIRALLTNNKVLNAVLMSSILIIVGCSLMHVSSYDQKWQDYFAIKKTAGSIVDYDHIKYDYNVFTKAGLSLNDYFMIKIWGYSDGKVFSKDKLKYIVDNSINQRIDKNITRTLQDALAFPGLNYILATLSLTIFILILYKHNYGLLCISILIPLILCVIMIIMQGRFPTRISTTLACFLPWGVLLFSESRRKNSVTLCSAAILAALGLVAAYKHFIDISSIAKNSITQNNELHRLGKITAQNPITLVTLGAAFPYEAMLPFESPKYLSGIRFIWQCGMNQSPIQKKQLTDSGIQDLFSSLISGDKTYISFNPAVSDILKTYFYEHYRANVSFLPVYTGNSFSAYQVSVTTLGSR